MASPYQRFHNSITKDNLWIYILKLLEESELYPYEIRKKIKEKFGFMPGNVTAYVVLKKLRVGGYVEKGKSLKSGGPQRTYYMITEKGKKELEKAKKLYKSWSTVFI